MRLFYTLLSILFIFSCAEKKSSKKTTEVILEPQEETTTEHTKINNTAIVILGTIQDAGSPQIGCKKDCCAGLFEHPDNDRQITSLGLLDSENDKSYLFEATPDIVTQMKSLIRYKKDTSNEVADGIFLTHAHIGHYTGLMFLGKEAMDAKQAPVYTMPKMKEFLTTNGPWSQLVKRENIVLKSIASENPIELSSSISVTPIIVPHRDEYSETVGYKIKGPNKTALFIPDIDKWEKWDHDIISEIQKVDYAFLDATFYSGEEINNRDISQIPHPFIVESLEKFKDLSKKDKSKIIFIHFNHTNPVINIESEATKLVVKQGFSIARINDVYNL
ncbi:pyrroloquinoline quinone biosynthesis protein PqqB [Cellulophaga baltica]|uniref:MBL fold metallo-hydrolase n=1 Tax=Cellulophaga TaxID=104264 RepID=UPI001C06DA47|nr:MULTISPECIES: MBL fold metallo-hydrolase [Cellulophaga]MBU2995885.1 pyrroloquinoline quinone biosynthesis protein PqqB [Cellulophaga baltica]MDO6767280.1 MBL fold metallo-hydrolase [Cellulophaga sp. 1_MG-2023]